MSARPWLWKILRRFGIRSRAGKFARKRQTSGANWHSRRVSVRRNWRPSPARNRHRDWRTNLLAAGHRTLAALSRGSADGENSGPARLVSSALRLRLRDGVGRRGIGRLNRGGIGSFLSRFFLGKRFLGSFFFFGFPLC